MANGVQDGQLVGDVLGKGVGTGLGIEHGTEIEEGQQRGRGGFLFSWTYPLLEATLSIEETTT